METITNLFKILWAPRQVLHEVAQRPRIIAPLLFVTLFAGVETAIVLAKLDPGELRLQEFERGGYADKISDSDKAIHAAAARSYLTMLAAFTVNRWVFWVLVSGTVFYLMLGMGRGIPLKPFFAVTAFAFIPTVFRAIAMIGTVLTAEPTLEMLTRAGAISPVWLVDPATVSPTLYQALGMLDVITIWILVLLIIGYGFVLRDRVSTALRVSAVVGAYLLLSFIWVYIIPAMA